MPRRLSFTNLAEFRHMYWDGWPEARMARYFRVDPSVVRRLILQQGLLPRTYYDSNRYLAQERSEAQRYALTVQARAARWRQATG